MNKSKLSILMDKRIYNYINTWKTQKNVIGILVCGSHATKLSRPDSDVDLRILYSENQENSRKKGVKTFENLSFSYLTGTVRDYLTTLHNQFFRQSKFEARMFALGVILFDSEDELKKLSKKANSLLELAYEAPSENLLLLKKYMLSNHYNFFIKLHKDAPLWKYHYFQFIDHIFKAYSFFIGFETPSVEKLNRVLFDDTYNKVNNFEEYPDSTFLELWQKAINSETEKFIIHVELLYAHVQKKWGQFNPNDFEAYI
ncbi:hypothetical protein EZY14_000850 [Kordia sp. TARA_039_SRF]|nr:hypothetical protein EZY14_000850 [Kordia sp. TARA_039_SRF]